jgi:hypothetical protein
VLATDLDGTLLRSDGTVSVGTRAALEAAWAVGVLTVFVTARPPRWLDELVDHVGDHGIAICGNGAFVYDVAARTVVTERGFSTNALLPLVRDLRDAVPGIGFAAERADGMGREVGFVDPYQEEYLLMDHGETTRHPVGKLLARSTEVSAEVFHRVVAEVVGDRAEIGFSGAMGLAEMTAPGVTKAAGLAAWCAERDLGPTDVVACGDMPNDLPMLRWAGHGVAVANAHPDVLAAADEVVASNDDDGVAAVLRSLI